MLIVGGSLGLTGAPSMSSEAAQRTGAGYVTACVPALGHLVFELRLLEAMSVPLPEDDGALGPEAVDAVPEHAQRADAIVLGPGLAEPTGPSPSPAPWPRRSSCRCCSTPTASTRMRGGSRTSPRARRRPC